MAQFNSLLVTGDSRFLNPINGNARNGVYSVVGTQTASTSAWTGAIPIPALYNGLKIAYYLPYASTSTAVTLNLTLSNGTATGAINCYYNSTTRLTTHYGVATLIFLTYYSAGSISISGTATTDNRWIAQADYYYDQNALYIRYYNSVKAKTALTANTLIVGDANGYSGVSSGVTFSISYPILWTTVAVSSGSANYQNMYSQTYDRNLTSIKSGYSSTANKAQYLIVTVSGITATVDSNIITDTLPSTDDGKVYIYLGKLGSQSTGSNYFIFEPVHPMFWYKNGSLQPYSPGSGSDYIGGTGITIGAGNAINHSNSVATQTTQKVYPITIDAQGHISAYGTSPTTLSGYGITDANISSGVITLGSNTITPLTSASTLDATKLSGTIPSGCYTDQNVAQAANASNNNNYELLFEDTAGSGTVTSGTRKSSHLTYNPSTSVFAIGDTAPSNGTITVSNVTTSKINSVTLPASPKFTDQAVQQLSGGNNVDYQVLFEDTSGSGEVTSGTRKHSGLVYNPNTSTLTSTNMSATSISSTSLAATTITGSTLNGQTIPASPVFTDQAVQQLEGGNNTAYELLYEDTASSGDTTSGTRKSQNLTYNPVSNTLTLAGKVDCTSMSVTTPTYTLNKTSGTWNVGSVSAKRTGNVVQMTIIVKGTGTGVTCGTDGFVGSLTGTGPAPTQDMTLVSYTGNFTIVGYIDTSRKIWIRPIGSGTYTAGNNSSIQVDGTFICE